MIRYQQLGMMVVLATMQGCASSTANRSASGETRSEPRGSPLSVRVILSAQSYVEGDAIPVEIQISNAGRRPIKVPSYALDDLGNNSLSFAMRSVTTADHFGPYGAFDYLMSQGHFIVMEIPQDSIEHTSVTLAGKETATVKFDLLTFTGPLAPGHYLFGATFNTYQGDLDDDLEFDVIASGKPPNNP